MYPSSDSYSFRPVEERDLDMLADHRNDYATFTNLTSPLPVFKDKQQDWLRSLGYDKMYFIGEFEDKPVAFLRLTDLDWVNRNAAVGIDVFFTSRGRGHAKALFPMLVQYCFNTLNLERVWLLVRDHNSAAQHIYTELGFKEEGRLRNHVWFAGDWEDYIIMGLLREEW